MILNDLITEYELEYEGERTKHKEELEHNKNMGKLDIKVPDLLTESYTTF